MTEWEDVVDAWQLDSWEIYRDVRRLGRKARLPEATARRPDDTDLEEICNTDRHYDAGHHERNVEITLSHARPS